MFESDRCSWRKSLRQTHTSCLRELCSSIKSCCNLAFLEPVPLLAAFSRRSRGAQGSAPANTKERAAPACCSQKLCKAPQKNAMGGHCRRYRDGDNGGKIYPLPSSLHRDGGKSIPSPDPTCGAPLSSAFVRKTAAGGRDRRVPPAANLNPKAFSAGQALKTQFQSKVLNGCNLS